ncbi:MAG: TonB-dependent receptor, partial [Candidatus Aminicenantes bacterium]|nr:TonB-dependent receptor [Candidatus Aminicenantes bacterium]
VVGRAPREVPLATVTTIKPQVVELMRPRDLAEALRYAPGVMVTTGNKDEYTLKLRGIDSRRIALLVDGVPVVEPYYGSFDLKTVSAGGIQTLQITKGPSSVLYGPNTLGGIVNVITRRPTPEPRLALNASYGDRAARGFGLDTSHLWGRVGLAGSALYQTADGYSYPDASGSRLDRANSDFERLNINGKLYYIPSDRTELMLNVGHYHSVYGMPPDLYSRPRYWRFKNWDRTTVNAGGFTSLGERSTLRFRAFYVNYLNTLDQYNDEAMTARQFESTFDNANYGFFVLADLPVTSWNVIKTSLSYQKDIARSQDDVGLPWQDFDQETASLGLEDHLGFLEKWQLIGGVSADRLSKFTGRSTARLNPLVGLKFTPWDELDLRLAYSGKSKFPNMRALYSPSSGNPDLKSESARSWELGFTYSRSFYLAGAVFLNDIRNLVDSIRLPSGLRQYRNIGQARLNGIELQVQKAWTWLEATVNYTYLDHWNETDNRPLDITSRNNLTFELAFKPLASFNLALFGLWASESSWYDTNARVSIDIPAYFYLDAVVSFDAGRFTPFIRVTNLFDQYFYTEPGYPWRGRFIEVGIKADVL